MLGLVVLFAVVLSAEPLSGSLQLRGLRWAPEKQADVEECSLSDAHRLELVELVGNFFNRDRNPLWGMTAEVRLRWQEGPDDDSSQAMWTPWSLVDTRPVTPIPAFTSYQFRTRLDVEGRRLWLKKRHRWPYAMQVQLTLRRDRQAAPVFAKVATLSIPAVAGPAPAPPVAPEY